MELKIIKSAVVITPTIGGPHLAKAISSVQNQSYPGVRHLLVVDGRDAAEKVLSVMDRLYPDPKESEALLDSGKIGIAVLWNNVGKDGWYGHRVYSAFGHLVDDDYVFLLDEDNWYKKYHVEKLVESMDVSDSSVGWSLRWIADEDGSYICKDNCESVGPPWSELIDTSSFAFKNNFFEQTCHLWHNKWGADRAYLKAIREQFNPRMVCSKVYSCVYRCGGNPNSPKPSFFKSSNEIVAMHLREQGMKEYPWSSQSLSQAQ